jgi:transaldolase
MRNFRIKVFADGADLPGILELASDPLIKGFTTNPTLMRRSGVVDYERFAREVLAQVDVLPISFEVVADEFDEMARQARIIAGWGSNVYVKIPIVNTRAESSVPLIKVLSNAGVKLNVTAVLSLKQVRAVAEALNPEVPAVVSVFAGRIADTGVDPGPIMAESLNIIAHNPLAELLWASPREILNVVQADESGCHIITVTHDLLQKLKVLGRDLESVSLDTVKMFYDDALASGLNI